MRRREYNSCICLLEHLFNLDSDEGLELAKSTKSRYCNVARAIVGRLTRYAAQQYNLEHLDSFFFKILNERQGSDLAVRLCSTSTEHVAAHRDLTTLSARDNRLY